MRVSGLILILGIVLGSVGSVYAQHSDSDGFEKAFQSGFENARGACKAMWSDRAFDSLRARIPLGEDKPTFAMLKNNEKLKANERPLADLAIKTLEKCRTAYTDVYAMLPPQTSAAIHGVERQQDALIADLYRGKISFGEFNASISRLTAQLTLAVTGAQITEPPGPIRNAKQICCSHKSVATTRGGAKGKRPRFFIPRNAPRTGHRQ